MKTSPTISVFDFNETPVRASMGEDGQPWFVAADVCRVLELGNNRQAVSGLDDDEKGVTTSDTLGGTQKVSVVSESGLYALIFKSRKPAARSFRKWVTQEVLPALRQNGSYAPGGLHAVEEQQIDRMIVLIESVIGQRMTGQIDNGAASVLATLASQYLRAWDVKLRLRATPVALPDRKEPAV